MGTSRKAPPWSYSRLKSFQTCPKQFYHLKVAKDYVEPETDAMRYGNRFHKAAEDYIASDSPLPSEFKFAQSMLDKLYEKEGAHHAELKFGLTENLEPCDFFDDAVWYRGIADLVIEREDTAFIVDYKTGSSTRYADMGQLELMALCAFKHYPSIETVNAALLFVVPRKFIKEKYRREDEARLWEKWLSEHRQMELAFEKNIWHPRPSGLCKRHCIVEECPYHGGSR